MSWLKRKKAVVRAASLLILSGCTIQANDVQLREETARGFKNHEEAITTLAKVTEGLLQELKAQGILKEKEK